MKRKGSFAVHLFDNDIVAVAENETGTEFHGMIRLNETGLTLWKCLLNDVTEEDLIHALLDEYEVDYDTAKADVESFLEILRDAGLIED